jgi:hypothetical protein
MPRRQRFTFKRAEDRLNSWRAGVNAAIAQDAEALAVRNDMVAMLVYVRDNKVVGTQSTGNMPLKAVREVTARFADPPALESVFAGKTFRVRSEEDVWPLHLLHVLAEVGGLIQTGRARRWRLTPQGDRFLNAPPILQAAFLLAVWWHRVNWLIAYPLQGMGDSLPPWFTEITLAALRSVPLKTDVPFDQFADALIAETGLTWTARDTSVARQSLRASIQHMVVYPLERFGAVACTRRKEPLGKGTVSRLDSFRITRLGGGLLTAVALLGD